MPPTLELAWDTSFNTFVDEASSDLFYSEAAFQLHSMVTGYANNAWVVAGSSDGATAGMDATDRWLDNGDIDWHTSTSGARSWMVWTRTPGDQILFDCRGTSGHQASDVWWSPTGGFTGGTTTARPTATDEIQLRTSQNWIASQSNPDIRIHGWHSQNGEHDVIVSGYAGDQEALWLFSEVLLDDTGWTVPRVADMRVSTTANSATYAALHDAQNIYAITAAGGTTFQGALGTFGFLSDAVGQEIPNANAFTSRFPGAPVGFASNAAAGYGWHGRIPDIRLGPNNKANGDDYETHTYEQVGALWLPGDGATTLLWV